MGATLYFDGGCGLCHRAVLFLLARDPEGALFRFAPLGGETFLREVPESVRVALPDSLVLSAAEGGGLLVRSDAVLGALSLVGGGWGALARLGRLVPRPLRDGLYDAVARGRSRIFAAPSSRPCPVVPAALRDRFLP